LLVHNCNSIRLDSHGYDDYILELNLIVLSFGSVFIYI